MHTKLEISKQNRNKFPPPLNLKQANKIRNNMRINTSQAKPKIYKLYKVSTIRLKTAHVHVPKYRQTRQPANYHKALRHSAGTGKLRINKN